MMSEAVIRVATPDDAEDLASLTEVVAAETIYIVPDQLFFTPDQQRYILHTHRPEYHAMWVAEIHGHVVGECEMVRGTWSKNAHSANLAIIVHPEFRGQGLGTHLLNAADTQAREWGVHLIWLTVFDTNEGAKRLYTRAGYTLDAVLPRRYRIGDQWIDECVMSKQIDPSS